MANLLGIDVSVWQDDNSTPQMMDWKKAIASGARFAFIKASQSTWQDGDFVMNWNNSKYHGMPRSAYHYLDWNATGLKQANFFIGLVRKNPGDFIPVVDYEKRTGCQGREKALATLKPYCEEVSSFVGEPIILYTSPGFWKDFGSDDPYWAQYRLWIANYEVVKPFVPAPWTSCDFWQYTSKGDGLKFGAESKSLDMDWCLVPEKYGLPPAVQPDQTIEQLVASIRKDVDALKRRVDALEGG